ncbi:MAG TPA: HU family DNA-binding protein [Balneolaceae bacterium]|nr:HU family DNA-binding protein [Balneolaceae bacterium]
MSEKVTFRELIDAIAEETENSKQFTHDFLKDFVDVINTGLEEDGSVNIAGFGKFNLKQVDERDGYNPQTEEKITIPAHNKVVFKPYKDLRELVNAPYAHLEAKLIEQEEDTQDSDQEEVPAPSETTPEDDFIPTAPPTSHDLLDQENADEEIGKEQDDPFGFSESASQISSSFTFEEESVSDDEEDIVEYNTESTDVTETEEELDDFLDLGELESEDAGQSEEVSAEQESEEADETASEEASPQKEIESLEFKPLETGAEDKGESNEKEETTNGEHTKLPPAHQRKSRKKTSAVPVLIAAIVILLLFVGGAWYLGFFSGNRTVNHISNSSVAKTNMTAQKKQPGQQDNKSQATATQSNKQQQKMQNNGAKKAVHASQKNDEEITVSKGQTLWSIARAKYDNPRLWPWIYDHNESLDNPNLIIAGNSLSVPLPSGPQYGLTTSDSVEVAKGYIATYKWYKNRGSDRAKNYLWVAKKYHSDIRNLTNMKIDKDDLAFANQVR